MRKREAEDRARQEEERRQQEEERTRREAEEKVVVFWVPQGFLQAFPLQPGQSQLSVESAGFKHSSPGDKGHGPRLQFVQSKPKSS